MRKIVLFMHTSLDGFVAGSKGEMNWIIVDETLFDYALQQTDQSDTALYGRITYDMMQNYWPSAGDKPDASKHDKEHSLWYNSVQKVVISKSMKGVKLPDTTIISNDINAEVTKLKKKEGKDILIFGSPSVAHILMAENLIDDYWIFVNPVLLGKGIPLFKGINDKIKLKFLESTGFSFGVVCLHYQKI
jgi:dihydrofolate reductase